MVAEPTGRPSGRHAGSRLVADVREVLDAKTHGFLRGISVTAILELLEMERKTATVTVAGPEGRGSMCFVDGFLVLAIVGWEGDHAGVNECLAKVLPGIARALKS